MDRRRQSQAGCRRQGGARFSAQAGKQLQALNRAVAFANGLAALGLFVMMVVTVVDVVGRYVFNAPLPAGFELTEYLMGLLVFLALPLVSRRGEHIRINLLDGWFSPVVRETRDKAVGMVAGAVCLVVAWPVAALGFRMAAYHDGTQTLGIPLAPLAFFIAASLVLSGGLLAITPFLKQ